MGNILLGACLGIAAWCIVQMLLAAALRGHETTITWGNVATNGGFALLFLFVAVLSFVGLV